jgi:hypothetical protein
MKQGSLPRRPARARLRCESLEDRTQPSVLSFRGGLDTQILATAPNQTAGAAPAVGADTVASGPQRQALLRFDNLFGTGPGQIPPGSTINRASLALWVGTPAGTAAPIELHRLNVAWDPATATWNTFGGNGIQADGGEAAAAPDGTVPTPTAGGFQMVGGLGAAVAAVAATAYSFYQDATGQDPNSGGAATLYLNAGPGVDPNALPGGFEMAPVNPGWQIFGDNVCLENVRLHGCGLNPAGGALNYGIFVGAPASAEVVLQTSSAPSSWPITRPWRTPFSSRTACSTSPGPGRPAAATAAWRGPRSTTTPTTPRRRAWPTSSPAWPWSSRRAPARRA